MRGKCTFENCQVFRSFSTHLKIGMWTGEAFLCIFSPALYLDSGLKVRTYVAPLMVVVGVAVH